MPRNSSESPLEMAAEWQRGLVLVPGNWIEASVASRFLGTSWARAPVLSRRSAFAKWDSGRFGESARGRGGKQHASAVLFFGLVVSGQIRLRRLDSTGSARLPY